MLAAAVASPPLGLGQEYVEIAGRTAADSSSSKKITVHLWVVELDTDKLRNLGFDWSQIKARGETTAVSVSTIGELGAAVSAVGDLRELQGFLKALEQNNLARTLSQPTITTLSGRQASFAVGPMELDVTPAVIDGQRVQLQYRIEVSPEAAPAASARFIAGSTVQVEAGKPCLVSQTRSSWLAASGKSRQTETLLFVQADCAVARPSQK
jgi:Flp pilus assembly secretin CpaC